MPKKVSESLTVHHWLVFQIHVRTELRVLLLETAGNVIAKTGESNKMKYWKRNVIVLFGLTAIWAELVIYQFVIIIRVYLVALVYHLRTMDIYVCVHLENMDIFVKMVSLIKLIFLRKVFILHFIDYFKKTLKNNQVFILHCIDCIKETLKNNELLQLKNTHIFMCI